jgi:hypothetical protein
LYVAEAARRAYELPKVDLLINFLVRDEPSGASWTSGFFTSNGSVKPSFRAFALPFVQLARHGSQTTVWGQVRPRTGAQPYRLERLVNGRWSWIGTTSRTASNGYFTRAISAVKGAKIRVWSPLDGAYSLTLTVS